MTAAGAILRVIAPRGRYLLIGFGLPVAILLVAWAGSIHSGLPMAALMRDTAEVAGVPAYTGLVSNLGGLLWAAAASVALTTAALRVRVGRRDEVAGFFGLLGMLSAALMMDDVFMLHDRVFPYILGLPEWLPVALHAALLAFLLVRFRTLYLQWNPFFLAIALLGFAVSLGVDLLPEDSLPAHYVIEDGFKLLGIVNWLAFTVQSSFRYLGATPPLRSP